MLLQLQVKNFALIDDMQLDFQPGLNVLSGETGAGKSIVVGALNLVLGGRSSAEDVREGENRAFMEAVFATGGDNLEALLEPLLEERGVSVEDTLIFSREVQREGRSVGRINGRAVPVSTLKEVGAYLIDLHGQHQHQSLLNPEQHRQLLDEYGGDQLQRQLREVESLFRQKQKKMNELQQLGTDERERNRRAELLSYQAREIEEARLSPEEEEQLRQQHRRLAHAEKIMENVSRAHRQIAGEGGGNGFTPLRDRLGEVLHCLNEASQYDPSLKEMLEIVENAQAQLEEATLELGNYLEEVSFQPGELESVQHRLEEIENLKKKYGSTVEEVIQFGEECREELERLEKSEETARQLQEEVAELEEQLQERCRDLTEARRYAAGVLEGELKEHLKQLALEKADFSIAVEPGNSISSRGWDRVEFMFSANPGETLKPLAKIVSGGEMSRVMLALKSVLAGKDCIPILIFDEVDAGIGGKTIQAVAEKMAVLGRHHQVICVTHSPHIASMADHHVHLYKVEEEGRTVTRASTLEGRERKEELARMLDGEVGPVNLQHVEAFLERAERIKETGV